MEPHDSDKKRQRRVKDRLLQVLDRLGTLRSIRGVKAPLFLHIFHHHPN